LNEKVEVMDLSELRERAASAFAKGKFAKAAEIYESYCAQAPKDSQAWIRLGDAWSRLRKKDKATAAYYQAANSYAESGFFPRAIAACKLVLEIEPEHLGVKSMLEELYVHKGIVKKASFPSMALAPEPKPSSQKAEPAAKPGFATEPMPAAAQTVPSPTPIVPAPIAPAPMAPAPPIAPAPIAPAPMAPASKAFEALPSAELSVEVEIPLVIRQEERSPEHVKEDSEAKIPIVVGTLIEPPSPQTKALSTPVAKAQQETSSAEACFQKTPQAPEMAAQHASVSWAETMKPPSIRPTLVPVLLSSPGVSPASSVSKTSSALHKNKPQKKSEPTEAIPVFDLEDTALESTEEPLSAPQMRGHAQQGPLQQGHAQPGHLQQTDVVRQPPLAKERRSPSLGAFHAIEDAAKAGLEEQGENPNAWLAVAKHATRSAGLPLNIPLFSDLPQPALMALFNHCPLWRLAPQTRVIRQGEQGNSFFVICSGEVRVFRVQGAEQVELAILREGEFFGEMALLSGEPRSAFVEAVEPDTQVLEISADVLAGLSRKFPQVSTALWRFCRQRLLSNVMASSLLFRPFAQADRQELIRCFQALDVNPGTVVVAQNQMSEGLFVVLVGYLEVIKNGQKVAVLKEGELFGEISLLTKAPATASVIAVERSALLKLPANEFNTLISTHPQVLELLSHLMEERMDEKEEFSLESLGWKSEDFELLI